MLPARGVKKKIVYAFVAEVQFHAIEYNSGRFKSSTIVADMSKQSIYNGVRNYTTNIFFLFVDWPLLAGYDITDVQANAIASAFTDYIWEKIQNE